MVNFIENNPHYKKSAQKKCVSNCGTTKFDISYDIINNLIQGAIASSESEKGTHYAKINQEIQILKNGLSQNDQDQSLILDLIGDLSENLGLRTSQLEENMKKYDQVLLCLGYFFKGDSMSMGGLTEECKAFF